MKLKKYFLYFALILSFVSLIFILWAAKTKKGLFHEQYSHYIQKLYTQVQNKLENTITNIDIEAISLAKNGITRQVFVSQALGEDPRRFLPDFNEFKNGIKDCEKIQLVDTDGDIVLSTEEPEMKKKKITAVFLNALKQHFAIYKRESKIIFFNKKPLILVSERIPVDGDMKNLNGFVLIYLKQSRLLDAFNVSKLKIAGSHDNQLFLSTRDFKPEQVQALLNNLDDYRLNEANKNIRDFALRVRVKGIVAAYDIHSTPYRPWLAAVAILLNFILMGLVIFVLLSDRLKGTREPAIPRVFHEEKSPEFEPIVPESPSGNHYERPQPENNEIHGLVRDIETGFAYPEENGKKGIEDMIMAADQDITMMPDAFSEESEKPNFSSEFSSREIVKTAENTMNANEQESSELPNIFVGEEREMESQSGAFEFDELPIEENISGGLNMGEQASGEFDVAEIIEESSEDALWEAPKDEDELTVAADAIDMLEDENKLESEVEENFIPVPDHETEMFAEHERLISDIGKSESEKQENELTEERSEPKPEAEELLSETETTDLQISSENEESVFEGLDKPNITLADEEQGSSEKAETFESLPELTDEKSAGISEEVAAEEIPQEVINETLEKVSVPKEVSVDIDESQFEDIGVSLEEIENEIPEFDNGTETEAAHGDVVLPEESVLENTEILETIREPELTIPNAEEAQIDLDFPDEIGEAVEINEEESLSSESGKIISDLNLEDEIAASPSAEELREIVDTGEEEKQSLEAPSSETMSENLDIDEMLGHFDVPDTDEDDGEISLSADELDALNFESDEEKESQKGALENDIDDLISSISDTRQPADDDEEISLSMEELDSIQVGDLENMTPENPENKEEVLAESNFEEFNDIFPNTAEDEKDEGEIKLAPNELDEIMTEERGESPGEAENSGNNDIDFDSVFNEPPQRISTISGVEDYADVINDLAINNLKMSHVAVLKKDQNRFGEISKQGFNGDMNFTNDDPIFEKFLNRQKSLDIRGDLTQAQYLKERISEDDLKNLEELMIVPVIKNNQVEGMALVGRKKGEKEATNFQKSELHNLGFLQES